MLERDRRLTRVDRITESLVREPVGLAAKLGMSGGRIPFEGDGHPVAFSLVEFAEIVSPGDCRAR
jgi:hypothetical protein